MALVARADLRREWRALLSLALLLGLAGGVVLTRRRRTAHRHRLSPAAELGDAAQLE